MSSHGFPATVQKLWNYCNVLCDDGMSYSDHVPACTLCVGKEPKIFVIGKANDLGKLALEADQLLRDVETWLTENHPDLVP